MSPILDLQHLTPISLEELGEPKQIPPEIIENSNDKEENKKLDKKLDNTFNTNNTIDNASSNTDQEDQKKKRLTLKLPKKNKIKNISNAKQLPPTQSSELLLSIKDCELLSGISKVSIRKSIKEKEINYTLENGKYKIPFKELLKWCYSSTRRKNVLNSQGIGKYINEWKTTL